MSGILSVDAPPRYRSLFFPAGAGCDVVADVASSSNAKISFGPIATCRTWFERSVVLLSVAALCLGAFGCAHNRPASSSSAAAESEQPDKTVATVAVWDFENNTFLHPGRFDYLRRVLGEMVLVDLAAAADVQTVERVKLQDALEELKLGRSELVDEDSKLRLGRIVGARNMVFGSYVVMHDQIEVTVRLVEVQSGLIKAGESSRVALDSVTKGVQHLSGALLTSLSANMSGYRAAVAGADLTVWRDYERGLALMDARQYDEAIDVFEEVLRENSNFKLAEQQIAIALERIARQ